MKQLNLILGITLMFCLFLLPQVIFASNQYDDLSTWDSKKIIKSFPQEIYNYWSKEMTSGSSNSLRTTTLSLLKEIISLDLKEYFFKDLAIDTSLSLIKESIEISRIIGTGDVASIIQKVEKESVNIAVDFLLDYFFKDQMKVSFGAIDSLKGENIQYILIWKNIGEGKGKVIARFYSPEKIITPSSYKGYSMIGGFLNQLGEGQIISPFILELSGEMKQNQLGEYVWLDSPLFNLVFSKEVPDFGLRPPSLIDKYIISPIKEKLDDLISITSFLGVDAEFLEIIPANEELEEEIESINKGEKYIEEVKKVEEVKEEKKEVVCSKINLGIPNNQIIINEIAWMGSKSGTNNEWIELKNISGENINLEGFKLVDKLDQINITFGNIILKNGELMLLERTDDSKVPFKKADLIYNGIISNSDEELFLFNKDCSIEDYVSADPQWKEGDNISKRTMERSDDLSWHTYSGDGFNDIWGTPKEENSKIIVEEEVEEEEKEIEEAKIINYCSQDNLVAPNYQDVIINEIAWMGDSNNSNHEWIELKNVSGNDINLKGWQLLDKDNQIKIIFDESDSISKNGYYLLERTDDESVLNVKADKIYSGILSNSNESLRLFNPNCSLADEVIANPSWSFGDNSSRKTMERKADFNWQTSSIVNGTPRAENSAEQVIYYSSGGGGGGSTYTPTIVETITYCSQDNLVAPTHQGIIINEIAWMGDNESSSNEWIELKNISEDDISLHNWQLLSLDNKIKIVFDENDLILKGGYFLLERTDDDSVLNVSANKIYSGVLSNSNESLRLFDSNCSLIDEVVANPDWEKGNNEDKNTMQRNDDLTWSDSQGSPGENNSIPIVEEVVNSLLIISEIQTSGQEYVELFNQGSEDIDLCPDEDNCYYLSYYPLSLDEEGNQKYSWDNPYYHWKFPQDSVIPQGGYYLINIFGSFDADMIALTKEGKPYSSQIVTDGSFAISKGGEKIDAVGVRIGEIDPIVKEGIATNIISNEKKSLGRKWVNQKYKDTDNNFEDFELQNPSPGEYSNQIPPKIENIDISLEDNYRNSLVLSWSTPEDIDSNLEEIEYKIYYSLNQSIDENNLIEFSDYNPFEVTKDEGINKAILRNLYYNKEYYFAIKSFDKEGNESLLSNQFSFSTPAPNHQISVINGNSQNNNLFDYIGLSGEWSQESLNLIIESNYDAIILMSPALIDDSGVIYMSQSFGGGHRSVKAFRENNEVLWSYNCDNNCHLTSLSDDGTIYIIDIYSIKALTPSGKLKWRKDGLEEINGLSSVDSQGRFYFISGKKVYAAEDKGNEVQVDQVFESGTGINNIVIDKNDNIYLSSENLLIKAKFGLGKIGEYVFSSEKSEDYAGEISGKPYIYKINLTSNNEVIVNLRNYYYETANTLPMTCLFQETLGEPIWSKVGYKEPLAIGESQMFFWRYENYKMRLYGIDLSNGEVSWYKEWDTHGYALPINYIVSDKSNNVYFLLGSKLIGYNTNNITSHNPEEDVIAQISLGVSSYAISPGKNKLIFSYQKKITSLSY